MIKDRQQFQFNIGIRF